MKVTTNFSFLHSGWIHSAIQGYTQSASSQRTIHEYSHHTNIPLTEYGNHITSNTAVHGYPSGRTQPYIGGLCGGWGGGVRLELGEREVMWGGVIRQRTCTESWPRRRNSCKKASEGGQISLLRLGASLLNALEATTLKNMINIGWGKLSAAH